MQLIPDGDKDTNKHTMNNLKITASTAAKEKIEDILAEENDPNKKLRIFVQGGGCAGFSYGFMFDEDLNMDDFAIDLGSIKVVVDPSSAQYLDGAEIDYKESLMSSNFVINNPNAVSSCGCGSSFNPF